MPAPQNYKNHARLYPPYHFFVLPVLLLNVIVAVVLFIHGWPDHLWLHAWLIVVAFALVVFAFVARIFSLRVQDRVIRLEEHLRYQRLLTPELLAATPSLTLGQILALRFASDAELPTLLQRTLTEKLPPDTIKQVITHWRADNLRA